MQAINKIQSADPTTRSIALDIMQITDIAPLIPYLSKLRLEQLSLYGNRIKQLPLDLTQLKYLKVLDISNNLLGNLDLVLLSLKSLPRLSVLTINCRKQDQNKIKLQLTGLQILNGKEIRKKKKKEQLVSLTQQDLQRIAQVYDLIRQIYRGADPQSDRLLAQQFDIMVKDIMQNLTTRMKTQNRFNTYISILYAKKDLVNLLTSKYLAFVKQKSPQLYQILNQCHQMQEDIYSTAMSLIDGTQKIQSPKNTQKKKAAHHTDNQQNRDNAIRLQAVQVFKQRISQLEEQVHALEAQNKRYLQTMIRHAKGDKLAYNSIQDSHQFSRKLQDQQQFSTEKMMTKKQLKELIQDIYQKKQASDKKQIKLRGVKQTMEQYMYTYLIHKYGLKNLVVKQAYMIVAAIKRYGDDPDIYLFGKILRNECQESYRQNQEKARQQLKDLLFSLQRQKYPMKSNAQLKYSPKRTLTKNQCIRIIKYIYKQQHYTQQLFQLVDNKLIRGKKLQPGQLRAMSRQAQDKFFAHEQQPKILYQNFINLLLDFNLRKHQLCLIDIISLFQDIDQDRNGIINQKQFRQLAKSLGVNSDTVLKQYLKQVDPFNNQKITFSDCVQIFTQQGIQQDGQALLLKTR